jgi:cytochrome P450
MLGSDYATNTWPGCGEIDIMQKEMSPMLFMVLCIIQGVPEEMQMEIK